MSAAISIVIPAFNAEATLPEQLTAIAAQAAGADIEVIVADNGSADATAGVALAHAAALPSLRVVDASARRGPSAARNIGAAHATGAALVFCDADDVVGDGWLQAITTALRHGELVGGALDYVRLNERSGGMGAPAAFPLGFLPGVRGAGSGNLAVSAAAFASVGGFDEQLRVGEDIDLCCRLQIAGYAMAPCDDAVVHVRLRGGVVAAFRHSFAFGAADRLLRHRFARVSAAIHEGTWQPPGADVREQDRPAPRPEHGRRWVRLVTRRRIDPTAFARRLGRRLGERCARVDRSLPQVAPPG